MTGGRRRPPRSRRAKNPLREDGSPVKSPLVGRSAIEGGKKEKGTDDDTVKGLAFNKTTGTSKLPCSLCLYLFNDIYVYTYVS